MTRLDAASVGGATADHPRYDRSKVTTGVVHFGVGGFHRSHQAVYVDELLAEGHREWGICGVGTLASDRRMAEVLYEQDGLYTLLVRYPDGRVEAKIIGSIVEYLHGGDDPDAVLERLASPAIRLVSLTITEGGYHVDLRTGVFNVADDPHLALDLEPGAVPTTVFGFLAEGLARRRAGGVPPFAVVSCDNLPGNGSITRQALVRFATLRDGALGKWVRDRVAFPNSMVDRITPVTTAADVEAAEALTGLYDRWPVVCEPYRQWVLGGTVVGGPPLADVGVEVVDDVEPYEVMKLRLLNGAHQALAYLGYLSGFRYVDEACADGVLRLFVEEYLRTEAAPTLPPLPGVDVSGYQRSVLGRFANPHIRDTLARLAAEGSDRISAFVLPVALDRLRSGAGVDRTALVVAAWARFAMGHDEQGAPIEVVDRLLEDVRAAGRQLDAPTALLRAVPALRELADDPTFERAFTTQLRALQELGAHGAAAALLGRL